MTCTRETNSVQRPLDACTKDHNSHYARLLPDIVQKFTPNIDVSSRMWLQPRELDLVVPEQGWPFVGPKAYVYLLMACSKLEHFHFY